MMVSRLRFYGFLLMLVCASEVRDNFNLFIALLIIKCFNDFACDIVYCLFNDPRLDLSFANRVKGQGTEI